MNTLDLCLPTQLFGLWKLCWYAGFLTHIIDAIMLTRANKKAQPVKYAMNKNKSSWYSRNMGLTGTIIFSFFNSSSTIFLV